MARKLRYDWLLFFAAFGLVALSVVMVYSASSVVAEQRFGDQYYFVSKQITFVLVGCLLLAGMMRVDYRVLAQPGLVWTLIGAAVAGLVLVLLIGTEVKGARRWFGVAGVGVQPSEFAKFAAVVFTAALLERRMHAVNDLREVAVPVGVMLLVVGGLILRQPDLGTAITLAAAVAVMVVAAGLHWRYVVTGVLAALPALGVLLLTSAYTQYNITYHYSAHLIPFIFFLAILGATRFLDMSHRATAERADTSSAPAPALHRTAFGVSVRARPQPRTIALAASLLVASLAMSYQFGQIIPKHGPEFFRVAFPRPDPHAAVVERFVRQIPREAVVSTMSDIATHLTARRTIYLFPDVADAEYLLLDTDPRANYWPHEGLKARERAIRDMLPQIRSGQFGLVRSEDGVMLFKRGSDPAHNDEALRTLYSARYEAEEMSSDLDAPAVADPQASRGQARIATPASIGPDGKTALVFGPYADLPPGKYRAEFILKTDRTDRAERVATVDVFTHKDGYARATREIPGTDFAAPDRYQPFAIEFESDKPLEDLEYRVQYGGVGTLGLDAVRVTPVELWLK
jgi:hypothetical protein